MRFPPSKFEPNTPAGQVGGITLQDLPVGIADVSSAESASAEPSETSISSPNSVAKDAFNLRSPAESFSGGGIAPEAAARNARDINAYPTIGVSFGQTIGSLRIYVYAQNRSAQVPAVVYFHPSGHLGPFRFDYMMQAIPVSILHEPRYFNYESVALTKEKRAVFGTAILPVGERMILNPRSKLQVALYSNGGFAYFTRRILSEGAMRFNIALQFGTSFQYPVTKNSSVVLGYAVNHLSDSDLHYKNPGLDMNLVYAQYLIHLHKKQ